MSGDKQYDEYFERCRFYAVRVYHRLVKEIVYQLSETEYGYYNGREPYEADVKTDGNCAAVFDYERQDRAQDTSHKRPYIRYDIKYACKECYAYRGVESESCYRQQSYEVDKCDACHFYQHSGKVSCEQMPDVG